VRWQALFQHTFDRSKFADFTNHGEMWWRGREDSKFVVVGNNRPIITTMLSWWTLLIYSKAFPLHAQWTQVWSRMSGLYMGEHRGFGRRFRRVGRRGQRI
jgi:hypothetical protein